MVTLSPVGLAAAPVANQVSFLATFKEKLCRCVCATSTNQPFATVTYRNETPVLNGTTVFVPYEQTANALMSAKGYSEYVKKHGYHFTDALAEHVSKMMENANGQQHTWTTSQVKKSMESLGLTIPGHVTYGDAAYLANMYYADLYPDPLKDEASCLRAAYKVANDPDGYEGMIFCRWTADAIGKAISINWEKFV